MVLFSRFRQPHGQLAPVEAANLSPLPRLHLLSRIPARFHNSLPVSISTTVLLLVAAVAGVLGNFPVNDDWIYSQLSKSLAQTGQLHINIPSAPSLVGQLLLGAGLIRIVGFNHVYLRAMTVVIAVLLCWIINRILLIAGVPGRVRTLCLLTVVLNPISAHLTFSFMTEYYGYTTALAGVLVWFIGRMNADRLGSKRLISFAAAISAAILIGASFWIRQFCVAAFPAVLIGSALNIRTDQRKRVLASVPPVVCAVAAFSGVVAGYFWWARVSGNQSADFSGRLGSIVSFYPRATFDLLLRVLAYLTMFMLPVLASFHLTGIYRRRVALAGFGCLAILTAAKCAHSGQPDDTIFHAPVHAYFPYLGNIIRNAGVGPLTTTDLYIASTGHYLRWDTRVWILIEALLTIAYLLWAAVPRFSSLEHRRLEIALCGAAFCACSLILFVQASHTYLFDRYLFALVIGGAISMACLAAACRLVLWRGVTVLLVLAVFTVGGVHDYFAFNRARWELVAAAESRGIRSADLDGGWEVDGWFRFERPDERPVFPIIHQCMCTECRNDAFVIGVTVEKGYRLVESRWPHYWLASGTDLKLTERSDVPAGFW